MSAHSNASTDRSSNLWPTLALTPSYDKHPHPMMPGYLADPPDWKEEYTESPAPPNRVAASILHTTPLPTARVFLDQALAGSITHISPWKNPIEWIRAESEYVNYVVEEVANLTGKDEIVLARCADQFIVYHRLIVYVFAHLLLCAGAQTPSLVGSLKQELKEWKTWDTIKMIHRHGIVKRRILGFFNNNLQPTPHSHSNNILDKLMSYDVIQLSARLTTLINDDDGFRRLVSLSGSAAQTIVDLLHSRLDFWIYPAYKPRYLRALVRLSNASNRYPNCLTLKGVGIESSPASGGGFGDVYRGRLGGQKISIKLLKVSRQTKNMNDLREKFRREAVTWRQLSHPNILQYLGVYHLDDHFPRLCLLSPWMENGNVVEYLERAPNTNCVLLSLDVAQGLEYLHHSYITHGNLKVTNILISPSGRACVADIYQPTDTTRRISGTPKWQPPEQLIDQESEDSTRLNPLAIDIYAFGMVCYEMFSGEPPFQQFSHQRLISAVIQGERPPRPFHALSDSRGLSDDMWHLIETCWNQDTAKRPMAAQVAEFLRLFPHCAVDARPLDSHIAPEPQMWYKQDHPFCALAPSPEDTDTLKGLKRISANDISGLADRNQEYLLSIPWETAGSMGVDDDDTYSSTPEEPPEPLSIVIDLILPENLVERTPNDMPISSSMDVDSF